MSSRTIAVLGVIAAALLAYVLVFEQHSVTSKELSERAGRVLPSFVRDKVERITVQRKGAEVVLARKQDKDGLGEFTLRAPLVVAADADATDRLLGELEWLSARRTLDAAAQADLARFGVAAPRFRVSYQVGGATHVLAVGKDDVHGEGLYVRVDAEPKVFVVPKTLLEVIDHEPGYFRDKSLFPELTLVWVKKLAVRDAKVHTFTKDAGHWWLGEPSAKQFADDKKLGDMLSALSGLRASREVEPSERGDAERALAAVALSVEATVVPDETREDKKASTQVLHVAGPCGKFADERYAKVEARLVCVRASDVALFEFGALEPAEPRLFRAQPNEVERFVLARGKDRLAWKRDGTKWKSDVEAPADGDAIEGWLTELAAARVLHTQPLAAFEERGRLRLELANDQHEELVYGALAADGTLPVRRGDEALLVSFPGSVYDRLTPIRARFVPLAVWSAHQPSELVRFEARANGKQHSGALVDGAWRGDAGIESDRVRVLVRALLGFRALSYLTDHARPEHGLSNASQVTFWLRDGKTLTLTLGAATDRGAYAQVGQDVLEVGSIVPAQIAELAGGPRAPDAPAEDDDEHDGDEVHGHEEDHEH